MATKEGKKCPVCKKGSLIMVDSSPQLKTLVCSQCPKTILVKTPFGDAKEITEVVVPGVLALSATISILKFFGIDDIDDLIDWLDS